MKTRTRRRGVGLCVLAEIALRRNFQFITHFALVFRIHDARFSPRFFSLTVAQPSEKHRLELVRLEKLKFVFRAS